MQKGGMGSDSLPKQALRPSPGPQAFKIMHGPEIVKRHLRRNSIEAGNSARQRFA